MEGPPTSQTFCLFDLSPESDLLSGLCLNNNNARESYVDDKQTPPGSSHGSRGSGVLEISDRMSCITCQCAFDSREEQKEHYTLDWHRFNLKRRIKGAGVLSEEDFQDKTQAGDVSSISGSDSESSDNEDSRTSIEPSLESSLDSGRPNRSQRVLFRNGEGKLLSVYRCMLGAAKDVEVSPEQLLSYIKSLQDRPTVVILMAGGGHFAGAVFKGKEVLKHKTFHRYTVRAKRGTSQALHDAQNRSHMAKSAGAALRRYNQAALMTDINQLLQSWTEHLTEARGIFLRTPRSDKALFLGKNSPIPKKDPRVYSIPFCTRRATFREVQRVHTQLCTLQVHDSDVPVTGTRERPVRSRKPKRTENQEDVIALDAPEPSEEDEPVLEDFVEEELTLSTLDLRESEIQPKRKRKKKKKKDASESVAAQDGAALGFKSQKQIDPPNDEDMGEESANQESPALALEGDELSRARNALYTCCKTGDSETAKQILQDLLHESSCRLLNERLPLEQRTLLHVAAAAGHGGLACLLMDAGWDPALRDSAAQTPYSLCADKRTRNAFRKYREENPDRYNYSKSQIPGPISEEVDARRAEKKKAQRVQRKQKEKEEKEERLRKDKEEAEKKRFAALSDREKRALAAEQRLAAQLSLSKDTDGSNVRRCWLCGESLLGKVPFEYLNFTFCSTRCLQEHRRSQSSKPPK